LNCYDKATEINSQYAIAWNNIVITLEELNNVTEAICCYNKAVDLDPNYIIDWVNKGNALLSIGNYHDAMAISQI
jgi:tetratricopeptide (TPR) repeat protein